MTFVKFENPEMITAVLVCTDTHDELVFWCEYLRVDTKCGLKNEGVFHDNTPVFPKVIDKKTATIITGTEAKDILLNVAEATAKTSGGRYSGEIMSFLKHTYLF